MEKVFKRKIDFKKKIIKIIDKYDVISFDIFDTLIKRNCLKPHDIFAIVESMYNSQNDNKISDFMEYREMAEKKARENSEYEDVNLNEIYNNFSKFDSETLNKLKQLEIETELKFCTKNELMYEIYNYCKQKNKRIICISDMYLSKKNIEEILIKNGYNIENIYVSSEIRSLKRTGNLFKYVVKKCNIRKEKIIHIGDSLKSDFLIPKLMGIKTYLIPNFINNCMYIKFENMNNLNTRILYSFINNNIYHYNNKYTRIGYEILGPIAFAFCKWVHDSAKKSGINRLYFCARDMNFIQKAYKMMYGKDAIKNEYLYISRKSTKLPFLYINDKYDDFCSVITDKKMHLDNILENNGIKIEKLKSVIKKYDLSLEVEYNHDDLVNNDDFRKFYEKEIKPKLFDESQEQYINFMKYLESIGFDKKSAVVDLGWKGTIQFSLMKILKNYDLKGFYVGIEKRAYNELNTDNSFGFLFNQFSNNDYEDKIYSFRSLFEMFFSALHGSTIGYSNNKENYYILGDVENKDNSIINAIQSGAIAFIKDFSEYYDYVTEVNVEEIVHSLIEIGTNPTLEEAKVFGDLNFDNMICGKLAQPKKKIKYLLHPKAFIKDFFRSEWKVGFLKRLFVIKLPYYKFYNFMRRKKRK